MHSLDTRNQFLKLRVQGLSFNRIAAEIGVSKPTLIAWSRQRHAEIQAQQSDSRFARDEALKFSHEREVAELTHKAGVIRQELNSRLLQNIPTEQLHALLERIQHKLQHLEAVKKTALPDPPIQT